MNDLFEPPISTSNLYAPELEKVWDLFSSSFDPLGSHRKGQLVERLEAELCRYHQAEYCVTFSTGFWALVAAVMIKSLSGRSEVIVPSMTYRRLADVVFWSKHRPVFVDIEPKNLSIGPGAVEAAISEQTALILGVHPIVNCCDVSQLVHIAETHEVPIVFDAVESVHETFRDRRVGSFGVGEVFSLHASKLINGMEGGYVCTNEKSFRDELIAFRECQISANGSGIQGIAGTLNDAHAAFALAGLAEIDRNVEHNQSIYRTYCDELCLLDGLEVLRFDETQQTSYKNIVVKVNSCFPLSRDELVSALNQLGVLARAHYYPALHTKKYRYPVRVCKARVADQAAHQFINMPCGARVTTRDVQKVCEYLRRLSGMSTDSTARNVERLGDV